MKMKRVLGMLLIAFTGAMISIFAYTRFFQPSAKIVEVPVQPMARYANLPVAEQGQSLDFTYAVGTTIFNASATGQVGAKVGIIALGKTS